MSLPKSQNKKPGIKREFYPLPVEDPPDWRCIEIHIPNGDEYLELLRTVLKSLTLWFNYQRDLTHRGKLIADRFAFAMQLPELGCDMNCEELLACLAPLLDDVATMGEDLAALKAMVEAQIAATIAQPVTFAGNCEDPDATYSGALGVVKSMHAKISALYAAAESSIPDTLLEAFEFIVLIFPSLASMGGEGAAELVNAHFELQRTEYLAGYTEDNFEEVAAFDLYCRIDQNDCIFDQDVWGDWVTDLPTLIPDNKTAEVFGRFSVVRSTFLQQIAAELNRTQTTEEYFVELMEAFDYGQYDGATVPVGMTCPPEEFEIFAISDPGLGQQAIGFPVTSAVEYRIIATGTWAVNATTFVDADGDTPATGAFYVPTANTAALIYKIGAGGAWTAAGTDYTFTAPASGLLFMAINDEVGAYGDNTGSIIVTIEET